MCTVHNESVPRDKSAPHSAAPVRLWRARSVHSAEQDESVVIWPVCCRSAMSDGFRVTGRLQSAGIECYISSAKNRCITHIDKF
jgi:hypothetical protein